MTETESVSETSGNLNNLIQLLAQEDVIRFASLMIFILSSQLSFNQQLALKKKTVKIPPVFKLYSQPIIIP